MCFAYEFKFYGNDLNTFFAPKSTADLGVCVCGPRPFKFDGFVFIHNKIWRVEGWDDQHTRSYGPA